MSDRKIGPLPQEATALHGDPVTARDSPVNRLAAGIRRISELLVGRPIDDSDLAVAASAVAKIADDLEKVAAPGKKPRGHPDAAGHPQDFFPTSPMAGYANPVAPPVSIWAVTGESGELELRGRANFGYHYEGPPTCVHGGVIAELFDELLGSACIITSRAGMTGTLTIKYRKPTPLLADLDLVARQTHMERRKIFAWGGIYDHGELVAEAEGIFIEMNPARMVGMVNDNAKRTDALVDPALQKFIDEGGKILPGEGTIPSII